MNPKKYLAIVVTSLLSVVIAGFAYSANQEGAKLLDEGELLDRAIAAIEGNYVDPDRINPRKMLDGALNQIQRTIPEILLRDTPGDDKNVVVGLAEKRIKTGNINSLKEAGRFLHEIFAFIAQNYHGDTPPEEIEYAAIDGMLEVLDPHSNFMPPKVYNEFQVGTRGKFGGLGIVISIKDGALTVVAPIDDTPAARAGIAAGDRILQIDDESTINMSLTDAVNKMRGNVGTKVSIVIERAGQKPRKVTLTRAIINIESVASKLITDGEKRLGYLKVKNFQGNTDDDVRAALAKFHEKGLQIDGLTLDLRNNPGGLLNIAVDLANHFLKNGVIVSTVGAHEQVIEKESASGDSAEADYPIVVLVNEGSASASEIVAGALQANDRAVIMGRRSFGKGSVQTIFELGRSSALKLTIAQYKPAGTETIQLNGVTPDIELQPVTVDRKEINLIEDLLFSEMDLEQHLENSHSDKPAEFPKSPFHIRYLKPPESEKEIEARSAREYTKEANIEKDFAVALARRLIVEVGNKSRKAMLNSVAAPLTDAQKTEELSINNALKPLGLDWSVKTQSGNPKLKLSHRLLQKNMPIARARAGEKIELELTATNTGTGPYSRLIAVGQSDMPFLSNKEFPFGFVAPGATKSWSASIELPEGLPSQDLTMDISFEDSTSTPPSPISAVIPVDELPQPSFSFGLSLPPSSRGHSLATGTPIPFIIDTTNQGPGTTSAETAASISNECGEKLFIEKGREKLGVMQQKTTRRSVFRFHLAPDFAEPVCQIKLIIADVKRLASLTKKINLKIKEGDTEPAAGKYQPPTIELAKVATATGDTAIKVSGKVLDTDGVRDCFIFVGDKKVFYSPNPGNTNTMTFETTVPLEPGNNQVFIGARDKEDILSRKIVVIDRTSGERKKGRMARSRTYIPDIQP